MEFTLKEFTGQPVANGGGKCLALNTLHNKWTANSKPVDIISAYRSYTFTKSKLDCNWTSAISSPLDQEGSGRHRRFTADRKQQTAVKIIKQKSFNKVSVGKGHQCTLIHNVYQTCPEKIHRSMERARKSA